MRHQRFSMIQLLILKKNSTLQTKPAFLNAASKRQIKTGSNCIKKMTIKHPSNQSSWQFLYTPQKQKR